MSEETLVVGRRQLEGTINSPDTSLQITAEQRDRRTAGRVDGGRVTGAVPLQNRQTSVEGQWRNRRRQDRCRRETGPGLRPRRVKVVVPFPVPRISICLSLHLFFFVCQIIIKCRDDSDSLALKLL